MDTVAYITHRILLLYNTHISVDKQTDRQHVKQVISEDTLSCNQLIKLTLATTLDIDNNAISQQNVRIKLPIIRYRNNVKVNSPHSHNEVRTNRLIKFCG